MIFISYDGPLIRIRTAYLNKDKCTAVQGGIWNRKANAWEYLLTPVVAAEILRIFAGQISSEDIPTLSMLAARLSAAKTVLDGQSTLTIPASKTTAWQHQIVSYNMAVALLGLNDTVDTGGGVLFGHDMGIGKSKIVVDLLANHQDKIRSAIIICPNSIVTVWTGSENLSGQFERHATDEALKTMDIVPLKIKNGSVEKKAKLAETARMRAFLLKKQFIAVVNYESAWREPLATWIKEANFDLVVAEEAHRIKSAGSKVSKYMAKLAYHCKYRIGTTGTPAPHALISTAKVLTPNGWLEIGKLHIGDAVIGSNGDATRVKGVWPQGEKPLFTVLFSDGTKTICTEDHLWRVISRGRRQREIGHLTISTGDLSKSRPLPNSNGKTRQNEKISLFDKHGAPRWSIPLSAPVSFGEIKPLPLDPYLLGVLLGDGHIGHSISFTTADPEIADEVQKVLPVGLQLTVRKRQENGRASQYSITSGQKGGSLRGTQRGPKPNPIMNILDDLGLRGSLSHNKSVPWPYLWSSMENRLLLLQGLCDTDGLLRTSTCKFTTTSERLAKDVAFLIRSLGGLVRMVVEQRKNVKLPQGTRIDGRDQYVLQFRMYLNPFRLPRKADRFRPPWRNPSRNIVAITPFGHGDSTCITVEAQDGLFLTEDFVVTHNSVLDVYGSFRFLDPGIFGTSYHRFQTQYAHMGGFQNRQVLKFINTDELHGKMFQITHRVLSKDVLDLPEFIDVERTAEFSPEERRAYQEMNQTFCVELESGIVTAANALVKLLRLQEICSGFVAGEYVGDTKKKLLADVMEDFEPREPLVVFAWFTHDLASIREVAESQGRIYCELSGHANELDRWQSGAGDVLGVQIRSGKEGVDFTRSHYSIFYATGLSLGDYQQCRKRTDRQGQISKGVHIHLCIEKTVDVKILKALRANQEVIAAVIDQYNAELNPSALAVNQ